MKGFRGRLLGFRASESGVVLVMGFLLLSNTIGREMAGIVGIADVINVGGVNQTLLVSGINGVLIMMSAALSSLIVDRFNRIALLRWMILLFALIFIILEIIAFSSLPHQFVAALVYLVSQQQWLVFPIVFC